MVFELKDAVVLTLSPSVSVRAAIIKISLTEEGTWYGVKLDSGVELHGIAAAVVTKV